MSILETRIRFGDVVDILNRNALAISQTNRKAVASGDKVLSSMCTEARMEIADIKKQVLSLAFVEGFVSGEVEG